MQFDQLKRREFITLLGGAAATWPMAARAQQPQKMRRIGVLLPTTADDVDYQAWLGAFHQGLAQSGWIIGRNVRIDTRWAGNKADEVRRHAAELVALAPDVILAHGATAIGLSRFSTVGEREHPAEGVAPMMTSRRAHHFRAGPEHECRRPRNRRSVWPRGRACSSGCAPPTRPP